jgi:hypothetical protein
LVQHIRLATTIERAADRFSSLRTLWVGFRYSPGTTRTVHIALRHFSVSRRNRHSRCFRWRKADGLRRAPSPRAAGNRCRSSFGGALLWPPAWSIFRHQRQSQRDAVRHSSPDARLRGDGIRRARLRPTKVKFVAIARI